MAVPVALERCASYESDQLEPALDALLAHLGGLETWVQRGQRVILKPNLIAACPPERGATTHPELLAALCRRVLDLGATPIIADAPAWGGPVSVPQVTGIADVCTHLGVEFVWFDRHASLPSRYPDVAPRFHADPRVLEADVVINVPKLKAHQQLGFTGAMKNLYGCLAGREKALHHLTQSRTDLVFARYLVAFAASLPVQLHVMDAVLAMEGPGPRLGTPRELGFLGASTGMVELDAVMADILNTPDSHRLMLEAAAELDAGEWDGSAVPLLGETIEALAVDDFLFPELIGVFFSPARIVRGWFRNRRVLRGEQVVEGRR